MNLAILGIDAQIARGDAFHNDRVPNLKADYALANPPFNDSYWRGNLLPAARGQALEIRHAACRQHHLRLGQHMLSHLAANGPMVALLSNGSMSSSPQGKDDIPRGP